MTHKEFRRKLDRSPQQAHRELFEAYCGYVYTIVFNRLRSAASREDIEECICDVFADVYIYYDASKELSGDLSGFIGTIARRKAAELYKKRSALTGTVSIDTDEVQQLSTGEDIETEASDSELRGIILEKIAQLGEPDASILMLKYYYDRSSAEIAEAVKLTPENVRVRSGRAVKKLRKLLEEAGVTL